MHTLNRYAFAASVLASLGGTARVSSGEDPKAERLEPQRSSRTEEEIVLESVSSRETIPASSTATITLLRGPGGREMLGWGAVNENGNANESTTQEKTVPIEDLLLLRFPARQIPLPGEPPRKEPTPAAITLFLRDGAEIAGSVVAKNADAGNSGPGGAKERGAAPNGAAAADTVCFACRSLGTEPFQIPLESVKGLLVHAGAVSQSVSQSVSQPVSQVAGTPAGSKPGAGAASKAGREPRVAPTRVGRRDSGTATIRLRNEILKSKPKKDLLILLEQGRVEGLLESLAPDGIRFSSETLGDVRVAFDKVRAAILADVGGEPGPDAKPKDHEPRKDTDREAIGTGEGGSALPLSRVRVTLRDGTILPALLTSLKAGSLALRHPALGALTVPLSETVELAFLGGRLSYLSDRDPSLVKESLPAAFQENPRPFQRDASVLEGPLRMAGREYRKGLGVHAHSLLEYPLKGEYSRFQATIGLDESARPAHSLVTGTEGSVVFRVRLDGKPLLEKPLTWRDPPVPIDLSVKGGGTLSLEVDCGEPDGAASIFNFALDRADWAEARIIK